MLSRQFERQPMPNGPLPDAQARRASAAPSELDQWIDRMYRASQQPDNALWDQARHGAAQEYMCTPGGRQFQQQADAFNIRWDAQLQAQLHEQAAQQALQPPMQQATQGFSR